MIRFARMVFSFRISQLCIAGLLSCCCSVAQAQQTPPLTPKRVPTSPATQELQLKSPAAHQETRINISPLLEQLASEIGLTGNAAQQWIADHIQTLWKMEIPTGGATAAATVTFTDGSTKATLLDATGRGILIHDTELVVLAPTGELPKLVKDSIDRLTEAGIRQIHLRVRVIQASQAAVEQLGIRWSHVETASQIAIETSPTVVPATNTKPQPSISVVDLLANKQHRKLLETQREALAFQKLEPSRPHTETNWIEATSILERATPVLYSILSPDEFSAVMAKVKATPELELINAPSVSVFNGNSATISNLSERPLVTSVVATTHAVQGVSFQPKTRVYAQGSSLTLRPRLLDGKNIQLRCNAEQTQIRSIQTLDVPVAEHTVSVQLPEVAKTRFRAQMELPLQYAMAVSMTDVDTQGNRVSTITICQCFSSDVLQSQAK